MGKEAILHAAMFTPFPGGRWGAPLIIRGSPGTAKTSIIEQLAKRYGMACETLTPGAKGEGAFGVTPCPIQIPDGKGGMRTVLDYPPAGWVLKLLGPDGDECGVVFLDEINTAPPALQPALLGGIQNREFGGWRAGPRVRVFAAANYEGAETAGGGWSMPGAVANRLGHLDWPGVPFDQWVAFILGGAGAEQGIILDAKTEEQMVLAAWPAMSALANGQVMAFLRRRPELVHKQPKDEDPQLSKAWPSRRTWDYAMRALAAARIHKLSDEDAEEYICAFVGASAGAEFFNWMAQQDIPDPVSVLDKTVQWEPDYDRLDRTEAVLSSCTALVVPHDAEKRAERMAALWGILEKVTEHAKDIVLPCATALVSAKGVDGKRFDVKANPASINVLAKCHLMAHL